jgi:hypothetical protein
VVPVEQSVRKQDACFVRPVGEMARNEVSRMYGGSILALRAANQEKMPYGSSVLEGSRGAESEGDDA